eukprot:3736277-Amphidinium_carterae.1
MLLAVLADNRVARQADVLQHVGAEEVLYTQALPLWTWDLLNSVEVTWSRDVDEAVARSFQTMQSGESLAKQLRFIRHCSCSRNAAGQQPLRSSAEVTL